MNVLPFDRQCRVISALTDGSSIRGAARVCDVNRETALTLGLAVGEACRRLHNVLMQDLKVDVLEFDEIWGFVMKKQRRVKVAGLAGILSRPLPWRTSPG